MGPVKRQVDCCALIRAFARTMRSDNVVDMGFDRTSAPGVLFVLRNVDLMLNLPEGVHLRYEQCFEMVTNKYGDGHLVDTNWLLMVMADYVRYQDVFPRLSVNCWNGVSMYLKNVGHRDDLTEEDELQYMVGLSVLHAVFPFVEEPDDAAPAAAAEAAALAAAAAAVPAAAAPARGAAAAAAA